LEAFLDPWLAQASLWLARAPRRLRGEATARVGELLINLLPSFLYIGMRGLKERVQNFNIGRI